MSAEHVLPALDPVIHAQPRLRITVALAALSEDDMITFPRLQELTGMTAGNLATHLRKLEDARLHNDHQVLPPSLAGHVPGPDAPRPEGT